MNSYISCINSIMSKKQKRDMILLHLLMIISSVLEVCGVSSIIPILSALLNENFMNENQYAKTLCNVLRIKTFSGFVLVCVAGLFFVFLLKNVFLLITNNFHSKYALNFQQDVRKRAFSHYLRKEYKYFLNHNSSDIVKTLFDDVNNAYLSFDSFLTVSTGMVTNLFLFIAVFVIDWKISFGIVGIVIFVFLIIILTIRPKIKSSGELANESVRVRNKWIKEAIEGYKVVIVTQTQGFFERKECEADFEHSNAETKYKVLSKLPRMVIEMFSVTFIILFTALLVLSGEDFQMLIPKIGAIGLASLKLLPGMNTIITSLITIQYKMPYVKKISKLFQQEPEDLKKNDFPGEYEKEIKVDCISFKYDNKMKLVLDNASLTIPIGKMIGIIGTSGEGKTTFLDILLGLLPSEKGRICVDDVDISQNLEAWRNSIGYITQNTYLLDDSIISNVAFGLDQNEVDEKKAWLALEKAQIADFVRGLPNGIYTEIGERGVRLSGGQCQRIGIARALYNNPQILIFDEATSSLDSDTEMAVVDSINSLYGKNTIIVVAHRSVALERCDKIYQIKDGKFKTIKLLSN